MLFLSRSGLFRVSGEREEATCDVSHRAVSGGGTPEPSNHTNCGHISWSTGTYLYDFNTLKNLKVLRTNRIGKRDVVSVNEGLSSCHKIITDVVPGLNRRSMSHPSDVERTMKENHIHKYLNI